MIRQIVLLLLVLIALSFTPLSFAEFGNFIGELVPDGPAFDSPFGVAVDSNGNIIVTDIGLHTVLVFDSDRNFITSFDGSEGDGTAFSLPIGVVVDSNGRIIVGDVGIHLVQVYDFDGNFITSFDGTEGGGSVEFHNPRGVAVDSNGRMIVLDVYSDLVQVYGSDGNFITSFDGTEGDGTQFIAPFGVAVDSNDNIIVSDTNLSIVQVYDFDGNFITSFDGTEGDGTQFSSLGGVAVDSNENIIVVDNTLDIVQVYTSDGEFIDSFDGTDNGGREFDLAFGIAVDNDDNIIVVDFGYQNVQIFGDNPIETTESEIFDNNPSATAGSDDPNGACGDCTPPTLGLTLDHKRIVDRGFSYNGNHVQVEFWHTPYPLITARVGDINIIQITVYENSGVSYLDMVQFGLGATEIGQSLNELEVLIEVYFESFDENNIGVEKVIIKDRDNLIQTYATIAFVDIVKCTDDSLTKQCVQVTLYYSYREPTINNIMVVSVSDREHNTQNFYFNEGLEIVGESLNEAPTYVIQNKHSSQQTKDLTLTLTRIDKVNHIWIDDYDVEYLRVSESRFDRITPTAPLECNDPPLSEINVPTRLNCHFRELTNIWN